MSNTDVRTSRGIIRYRDRDIEFETLFKPIAQVEYKTIHQLQEWYLRIRDNLSRGFKIKSLSHPLTTQYHVGNPLSIGANWVAKPRKDASDLKVVPQTRRIYPFDFYIEHGESFKLPKGKLRQFLKGRTLGEVQIPFGDFGTQMMLGIQLTGKPVEEITYDYHIKGHWRGYHETTRFNIQDKHIIANTTRGQTSAKDLGNNAMYDNAISFFEVYGDNGYFTFNQRHPALLTGMAHDDYHRGHWLCGFHYIGNNNVFVINIHEPFYMTGWIANDTWGNLHYIGGENNLLIINVYPGARLSCDTKLNLFGGRNWDKNTVIVNCFGDAYISGNYRNDKTAFLEHYTNVWNDVIQE